MIKKQLLQIFTSLPDNTPVTASFSFGKSYDSEHHSVITSISVIEDKDGTLTAVISTKEVFRLVCTNGLIAPFHMDGNHIKYHKGRKLYAYSKSYEVNVDEIKTLDNEPYFNQVRQDLLNIANNNAYFTNQIAAMRRTREVLLHDVTAEALIKVIGKELLLTKAEQDMVKKHYLANADHSQYGLLNAVTRASQDIQDYNRATELERIGGDILFMNRNMMESIRLKAMGMK